MKKIVLSLIFSIICLNSFAEEKSVYTLSSSDKETTLNFLNKKFENFKNEDKDKYEVYITRLNNLLKRILGDYKLNITFYIYFSNKIETPLSFSGGVITISTGLMENISDEELLVILAHEVGHIAGNHFNSPLNKLAFSDSELNKDVKNIDLVKTFLSQKINHEKETDADFRSLIYLSNLGYNLELISETYEKLAKNENFSYEGDTSTHPSWKKRLGSLKEQKEQLKTDAKNFYTALDKIEIKDFESSIKILEELKTRFNNSPELINNLALSYYFDFVSKKPKLDKFNLFPSISLINDISYSKRDIESLNKKNIENAIEILKKFIENNPIDINDNKWINLDRETFLNYYTLIYNNLAILYIEKANFYRFDKDLDEMIYKESDLFFDYAEKSLKTSLKINPNNPIIYNNYGYLYFNRAILAKNQNKEEDKNNYLKKAKDFFEKAIKESKEERWLSPLYNFILTKRELGETIDNKLLEKFSGNKEYENILKEYKVTNKDKKVINNKISDLELQISLNISKYKNKLFKDKFGVLISNNNFRNNGLNIKLNGNYISKILITYPFEYSIIFNNEINKKINKKISIDDRKDKILSIYGEPDEVIVNSINNKVYVYFFENNTVKFNLEKDNIISISIEES